jgi:hypothetical protein
MEEMDTELVEKVTAKGRLCIAENDGRGIGFVDIIIQV